MKITQQLVEPLQWSEGMMLSPQHFQQSDIYWQQMLWHQMAQLQPDYWGLVDIEIDADQVVEGIVAVKRLQCVMPDGLVVQFPAHGQDETLSVNIADDSSMQAVGNKVKVFVTVPIRKEGAASPSADIRRYEPVNSDVVLDENTGLGTMAVRRLRPLVSLFVGQEKDIPAKYCAMPLFELCRDEAGFHITAYHPPILRLAASGFLQEQSFIKRLLKLTQTIRSKARLLAGVEDDKQTSAMPVNHRYRNIIRALVVALPPLEILVNTGMAHPFEVYKALAALDGQISGINSNLLPMPPQNYQHNNIEPAFSTMLSSIYMSVKGLHKAYTAHHFKREDLTGHFSIELGSDINTSQLDIELRCRPGQRVSQLVNWIKQSRIASDVVMKELKQRRLAGASAAHLPQDQVAGLEISNTSILFRISNIKIDIDGKPQQVIQPGKILKIEGGGVDNAPASVILQLPNESKKNRVKNG